MSEKIIIKQAISTDIPQLCDLLGLLFEQEEDFHQDSERQARGLRMILENPGIGLIFAAFDKKKIVGMVSLLFTVSTAEGGRAAWLEDLVVHTDQRRKGIGELLLQHAIKAARNFGCLRISLLTDSTNHSAMRFYERSGLIRSQMVPFRIKI